ncbi:MAG TPA: aminotransferase class I/II-fold pyridoxal phosphate-dependent enzyme [Actinomycetota bacterium]|nr:aminotransferase class I/II-fold pyridoxal phosphate-dependent enzyme [Actinomycetota bacterium]
MDDLGPALRGRHPHVRRCVRGFHAGARDVALHDYSDETEALAREIETYARERISTPQPLDGPRPADELARRAGRTITPEGIGGHEALRLWSEVLAPATISTDHPSFLAFIPGAPSKASALFDLAISASSTYAGSWIEGAGAVWAENETLRWLADVAGLPHGAGGVFVSGGTAGNLSALVTARHAASGRRGGRPERWAVACADTAHSSVVSAARVMDAEVIAVPHDERGRLTGPALAAALDSADVDGLFAVVASAGSTNAGTIDDLEGVAGVCAEREVWFHVDAAYGGAGLLAPSVRERFRGIERADSFIVDPHKWLFAPFDACALVYRDPSLARAAHRQEASYLDSLNVAEDWNASDYAHHLTRRARGLPLWFSLATYGTDAYRDAVESVLAVTRATADEVSTREGLELLMEPELSVVLFRRLGWEAEDYEAWWRRLLEDQVAFVQPTSWEGEKVARLCFVNPRTTIEIVRAVLDAMT